MIDNHMSLTFHKIPSIIAVTGYAGHGKDAIGNVLMGEGYVGMAFADPIRKMLEALLQSCGAPTSYMYSRALKEQPIPGLGVSYRQLAQTLGTEWARQCLAEDFWVRAMASRIESAVLQGNDKIVVTDLRFQNEENLFRSIGAKIIKVTRPSVEKVRPHASEAYIEFIKEDYHVLNDGPLSSLPRKLQAFRLLQE